jgi:hypothetical protein
MSIHVSNPPKTIAPPPPPGALANQPATAQSRLDRRRTSHSTGRVRLLTGRTRRSDVTSIRRSQPPAS